MVSHSTNEETMFADREIKAEHAAHRPIKARFKISGARLLYMHVLTRRRRFEESQSAASRTLWASLGNRRQPALQPFASIISCCNTPGLSKLRCPYFARFFTETSLQFGVLSWPRKSPQRVLSSQAGKAPWLPLASRSQKKTSSRFSRAPVHKTF